MFVLFIVLSTIASFVCSQSSSSTVIPRSSTSPTAANTWEDLIVMPIRVISELSRISIVMSRRDYTLSSSGSYTYIKYPSSYRATLTQATDIVAGAFRTAETSSSRVNMIMSGAREQISTSLRMLFEASIQERRVLLPVTLKGIGRMADSVTSASEEVSKGLDEATAFFDELFRAVQPSSASSTTASSMLSTSTQANKSPLDINHATVLSNILGQLKSFTAIWNQMGQYSNKLSLLASRAVQFIDERNTLLWMLSDMDQAMDLLSALASDYSQTSAKIITSRTYSIASYLALENEEERLTAIQTVNEREERNVVVAQKIFAQTMDKHEAQNKERRERYQQLAATPST